MTGTMTAITVAQASKEREKYGVGISVLQHQDSGALSGDIGPPTRLLNASKFRSPGA